MKKIILTFALILGTALVYGQCPTLKVKNTTAGTFDVTAGYGSVSGGCGSASAEMDFIPAFPSTTDFTDATASDEWFGLTITPTGGSSTNVHSPFATPVDCTIGSTFTPIAGTSYYIEWASACYVKIKS